MKTSLLPSAITGFDAFDSAFDEAVALIYAASRQPAHRRQALSLIAQSLGAAGAIHVSFVAGQAAPVACESAGNLPAGFVAHYVSHGAAIDPRRRFLEAAHDEGCVYVSHYDRNAADPREAQFFDNFLGDYGIGESLGARIAQAGPRYDHLYVERARGQPPFAPVELRLFRRFVRQLREAEQLAEAAERRVAEEALQRELLDELPLGTIIADKDRRVLFANAAARDILAAGDGLSLAEGRLQAARAFETNALAAHLRRAARSGPPADAALLVARPSGRQPIALLVAPLRPVAEEADLGHARMTVFLANLDTRSATLAPRLTQLFGLSKAEARVAAGVAGGLRLQEIAQASDVRLPTVRTQLRAVLRKLGVERQADLVRIALTLPATLPPRRRNDAAVSVAPDA